MDILANSLPFEEGWGGADFFGEGCEEAFDAVILGAGDYPSHPIPLKILDNAPFICCCDSSAISYIAHGHTPNAIVGDGDSLPQDYKKHFAAVWHQVDEQDDNDQTKATRYCVSLGKRRIAYIGATGRREDHTLGNISLMSNYLRTFDVHPIMFTDHGYFIPIKGKAVISTFFGQQISIFNLSAQHIVSHGLKWDAYPFTEWWQGTLNEALGNTITIEADGDVVVFLNYRQYT